MRTLWIVVAALAAVVASDASAQNLPPEVTQPYVAYTEAMAAQDFESAMSAAEEAWRAGEAAAIDPLTRAVLAGNYADLAGHFDDFEAAEEAYVYAAELLDSAEEDPLVRARAWRKAGEAALAGEREGRARHYLGQARDRIRLIENPQGEAVEEFLSIESVLALRAWSRGHVDTAGGLARRAFEQFPLERVERSETARLLAFFVGADAMIDGRDVDGAFWLSASYYFGEGAGTDPEELDQLFHWAAYARRSLDDADQEAVFARLQEAGYLTESVRDRSAWSSRPAGSSDTPADEVVIDAEPIERCPPEYPYEAAAAGAEGISVFRFDVTPTGETANIEILFSIPYSIFGEVSIEAVEEWRYRPKTVDGEPVWRRGIISSFDFRLEE